MSILDSLCDSMRTHMTTRNPVSTSGHDPIAAAGPIEIVLPIEGMTGASWALAALAMALSSVSVVTNSLRLRSAS